MWHSRPRLWIPLLAPPHPNPSFSRRVGLVGAMLIDEKRFLTPFPLLLRTKSYKVSADYALPAPRGRSQTEQHHAEAILQVLLRLLGVIGRYGCNLARRGGHGCDATIHVDFEGPTAPLACDSFAIECGARRIAAVGAPASRYCAPSHHNRRHDSHDHSQCNSPCRHSLASCSQTHVSPMQWTPFCQHDTREV